MALKKPLDQSILLRITILLIGLHSVVLGGVIYFFPVPFYQFFFSVDPDNLFFTKQSGIFLFLAGLFYAIPALNLNRYRLIIVFVICSKFLAVTFLLINANLTTSPPVIYLAAFGDSFMALALTLTFLLWNIKNKNKQPN